MNILQGEFVLPLSGRSINQKDKNLFININNIEELGVEDPSVHSIENLPTTNRGRSLENLLIANRVGYLVSFERLLQVDWLLRHRPIKGQSIEGLSNTVADRKNRASENDFEGDGIILAIIETVKKKIKN